MEGLLFILGSQGKPERQHLNRCSKGSSHGDLSGKSSPGSGSENCKDAEQGASIAGAVMGEEIKVGGQVMLSSLTSKPGLLEGTGYEDAGQQHWDTS